ncbi:hypothetical protein F6X40_09940 [Paraburkholderia sp. UCT31]|uniref:hypothetical protein n=1 Tax=Paraburkholderia sp. UCT31 TaxID=2615209 RepID=UPI0016559CAA|nr:hypothetical protein [Paraburkholderia sp. UCT31]MBC8737127.1 hypothetical protein [Paraburkholderia sp. UCT31]
MSDDSKFKPEMHVKKTLFGRGEPTTAYGIVLRVDEEGVWLDNGAGLRPAGPYHPETGVEITPPIPGMHQEIKPYKPRVAKAVAEGQSAPKPRARRAGVRRRKAAATP